MPLAALGPILIGAAGTSAAATAAAWGAIGAGATAGASLYGAHAASSAAEHGADLTSAAATHAADLQSAAAAESLAFEKQQAENAYQNSEATRKANYDLYAAREGKVNAVAQMGGLPASAIPSYVPGVDPGLTSPTMPTVGQAATGSNPTIAGTSSSNPGSVPNAASLANPAAWMALVGNPQQLAAWVQQGLGPKADPNLVQYYVGKIQGQPGANPTEQAGSANYWLQKLQSDPSVTGVTASSTPGSVGSYLQPYTPVPVTPALTMPGSVGAYLGAR